MERDSAAGDDAELDPDVNADIVDEDLANNSHNESDHDGGAGADNDADLADSRHIAEEAEEAEEAL